MEEVILSIFLTGVEPIVSFDQFPVIGIVPSIITFSSL